MILRTLSVGACTFALAGLLGCESSDTDPDAPAGSGGALAGSGGSGSGSGGAGSGGSEAMHSSDAGSDGDGGGSAGEGPSVGFGEPPVASDLLCGERPGRKTNEVQVLRFENADRSTAVQIRRVWDGSGSGNSSLFRIDSFAVVRNGKAICIDDASLGYTNTHHNWDDVAEADAEGVHYQLEFSFDTDIYELTYELVATAGESTLFEEPLVETGALRGSIGVVISELMLHNVAAYADEHGEFEPWIELYNPSAADIALAGYTLSNDFGDRTRWALPAVTLARHQVLVIFADAEPDAGPLHTNFRLSPNGGEVVLTRPDGVTDGGFVYGSTPADASWEYDWSAPDYVGTREPTPNAPPAE